MTPISKRDQAGWEYPFQISAVEMQTLELCNGRIDMSMPIIPEEVCKLIRQWKKTALA